MVGERCVGVRVGERCVRVRVGERCVRVRGEIDGCVG